MPKTKIKATLKECILVKDQAFKDVHFYLIFHQLFMKFGDFLNYACCFLSIVFFMNKTPDALESPWELIFYKKNNVHPPYVFFDFDEKINLYACFK